MSILSQWSQNNLDIIFWTDVIIQQYLCRYLNESSQQLKAIPNGIGEGITIIDEDLKIVWANPIFKEMDFLFLGSK